MRRRLIEALASRWVAKDLDYTSTDERPVSILERLADGRAVSGQDLTAGITILVQVIDGEFAATDLGDDRPWVTVKAYDSSWWEVTSPDERVLQAIRNAFRIAEEVEPGTA